MGVQQIVIHGYLYRASGVSVYMCFCGMSFDTIERFKNHILQLKNSSTEAEYKSHE